METLTIIYFVYIFLSLYFLSLFILTFVKNKKDFYNDPKTKKKYKISILIPVLNEEDCIEESVLNRLKLKYPIEKIFVIDNGSTDKTIEIVKKLEKGHKRVKLLRCPVKGKSNALNYGLKFVKTELFAVSDADSYPNEDAVSYLMGYFDDEKVGVVTSTVFVKNLKNLLTKMQDFEYKVIAFTRKITSYFDAIYVTNGPLSIYRTKLVKAIGSFDKNNLTEDIELTWNIAKHGYRREMSLNSRIYTNVPSRFKIWLKQRVRWFIGGFQCVLKYRGEFLRKGILGFFIIPFFVFSAILAFFGLALFFYLFTRRLLFSYLITRYSIVGQTLLLKTQDIGLGSTILNFYGATMLVLFLVYTLFSIVMLREKIFAKQGFFYLPLYLLIYVLLHPIVLIIGMYKYFKGGYGWGTK